MHTHAITGEHVKGRDGQGLRALAAFAEDPGSVPSTHVAAHSIHKSSSSQSDTPF